MAEMATNQKTTCRSDFTQELMQLHESTGLTKADMLAAISALDTYFNDNALAINAVLPQPFKGAATTSQKARLMKYVIAHRYINGN